MRITLLEGTQVGRVKIDCLDFEMVTPVRRTSWGRVRTLYF